MELSSEIINFAIDVNFLILGFALGLMIGSLASLINMIISAFARWVMSW